MIIIITTSINRDNSVFSIVHQKDRQIYSHTVQLKLYDYCCMNTGYTCYYLFNSMHITACTVHHLASELWKLDLHKN